MELLELLNPWWKEKEISEELAPPYRRKMFGELPELLKKRQIIVLSGLRRVGKSTMMYQLVEHLLRSGISADRLLYFSFDEKVEDVVDVLMGYSELTKVNWKKEKCFLFLDEVQKLADWSNKIKLIYDAFPNLKIIASGSSSFHLEKEAKVNLVGRHFLVSVSPLSFEEYLEIKGSKIELDKQEMWKEEIIREFDNYLIRPFPEIINWKEDSLIKSYIKDNVVEKVLRVDLPTRFKKLNEDLLIRLIDIFYGSPGMYVNYDDISSDLKISKNTLLQHIYYLEFAYLIRKIKNFRPSKRLVSRKLQRIYPFHWALMFGWSGKVDFETIVATYLDAKYYWRKNGKEVDFLLVDKEITPIEVKDSKRIRREELSSLVYFMKKFDAADGFVVYAGKDGDILKVGDSEIKKIPLWKLFLYLESISTF